MPETAQETLDSCRQSDEIPASRRHAASDLALTPEHWIEQLRGRAALALNLPVAGTQWELLGMADPAMREYAVADGVLKLLIRDESRKPLAVALCSAATCPDLVERGMNRAAAAKTTLGRQLGSVILDPLLHGRLQDLSYSLLPYRRPLSPSKWVRLLQRSCLRRGLLNWLRAATKVTRRSVSLESLESWFLSPLSALADSKTASRTVRELAATALQALVDRRWTPQHVLMHGDLWEGNVLLDDGRNSLSEPIAHSHGFILIDWPGSLVQGYPIFDLIRLANSMSVSRARLARELVEHCRILECDVNHAVHHLAAALAYLHSHLGHFPPILFSRMAQACIDRLFSICRQLQQEIVPPEQT